MRIIILWLLFVKKKNIKILNYYKNEKLKNMQMWEIKDKK